jgi:hypothetical protein
MICLSEWLDKARIDTVSILTKLLCGYFEQRLSDLKGI